MAVVTLNEYAQRARLELRYEDVGSVGPDHIKTFTVRAVLNGKAYPAGVGKNKKEAKHNAAANVLKVLEEPAGSTENAAEASASASVPASVQQISLNQANFTCWLNEYSHKNRVSIRPVESTRLGPHHATPCCSFVVGEKEYPAATGRTKKEAKEEAAKLVYHEICGSKTSETADERCNPTSAQQEEINQNVSDSRRLSENFRDMSLTETNFFGLVNHYCQKTNRSHSYVEEGRSGPAHMPQFSYKLKIDNQEYPVGKGGTVKEAQRNAARLAWSALQEQSDWDSKVSVRSTASEGGGRPTLPSPSTTTESRESSSQSRATGRFDVLSSGAQIPSRSTMSDDEAQTRESSSQSMSTQSMSTQSMSTQSMSTGASGSIIFADSSNSSKDQHAVNSDVTGNTQNGTSNQSRFTSDFEPKEYLGRGAFGCVYRAKHKLLERDFAVKIVRCELKEKDLREVGTLADLHHHNIIRYFTFWVEDSEYRGDTETTDSSADSYSCSQSTDNSSTKYLYIQMELCQTKTLKDWIEEKNNESVPDSKRREKSLSIAQQIVSGVEYIHSKKHIHRDLKPENILFGLDGEVKIGDFGLVTRDDDNDAGLMERTENRGTHSYMAPEQKKEKTYDRKVDIFALGLIYFELLWKLSTGHERVVVWDDARSQKLPEEFSLTFPQENQIIMSMMCEKPEDRPEATNLKAELENWAQTLNSLTTHQDTAN